MTKAMTEAIDMARNAPGPEDEPIGPIIAANLERLGYSETIIKTAVIAQLVREKTGKSMSRQRIAAILTAVRVTPETIDTLAKALGVKPAELIRKPKSPRGQNNA